MHAASASPTSLEGDQTPSRVTEEGLDRSIDDLYALDLESFTAQRDALAARVKREGDAEAAKKIKALRKPSRAAWAVNQLARDKPDLVRELVELRSRIKTSTSADALRKLADSRHRVIAELADDARALLRKAGHSGQAETVRRVVATLHAVGASDQTDMIRAGRLTSEVSATGFEELAVETAPTLQPSSKASERARREAEALAEEAERAERAANDLTEKAREAQRLASEAADLAANARRKAMELRDEAERAARAARRV